MTTTTSPNEFQRWFAAQGDSTHRLEYQLGTDAVIFDVGGYTGEFGKKLADKFGCHVHVFEPVEQFFQQARFRLCSYPKVQVHHFALGTREYTQQIHLDADGTSFHGKGPAVDVRVRPIDTVWKELGLAQVDLLKVNIEGDEFDLLPYCIEKGLMAQVRHLQVQFHSFVPDAAAKRETIHRALEKTHRLDWNYTFVWEGWSRRL
jgi:FkbM family methyltransferase